jgi:hypothetical protein
MQLTPTHACTLQVIAEDQSLLGLAEVQAGVRNALLDDAVSVREAAVDLVGRHIGTDQELALAYFDVMCKVCMIRVLVQKGATYSRSVLTNSSLNLLL